MKIRILAVCVLFLGLLLALGVLSSNAGEPEPAQTRSAAAAQQQAQDVQVVGQLGGTVRAVALQGLCRRGATAGCFGYL
jgi:hypothetical protein